MVTRQGELVISDTFNQRLRLIESATGTLPILSGTGGSTSGSVTVGNAASQRTTPGTGGAEYIFPEELPPSGLIPNGSVDQEWAFSLSPGLTSFQFLVTVSGSTLAGGTIPASLGTGSTQAMVRTVNGISTEPGWVDGQAGIARIQAPTATNTDRFGNVYFADPTGTTNRHSLRIRRPSGQVATIINSRDISTRPTEISGTGDTVGFGWNFSFWVHPDGKTIIYTQPEYIGLATTTSAVDSNDYLDPQQWTVRLIMGQPGSAMGITNGNGLDARFATPQALAGDADGNVFYIAEDSLIRRIKFRGGSRVDPLNWIVESFCGSVTSGFVNAQGAAARFGVIGDLELDSFGSLFVADQNNRVLRRVDSSGNATTYAGTGSAGYVDAGPTSSQFLFPQYLAIDAYGYIYVMDKGGPSTNRIRRVAPNREVRTVVRAASIQDGLGNTAGLGNPGGIAVGPDGTLFFADTGTLRTVERIVLRN
jgi:hypothetical protein